MKIGETGRDILAISSDKFSFLLFFFFLFFREIFSGTVKLEVNLWRLNTD